MSRLLLPLLLIMAISWCLLYGKRRALRTAFFVVARQFLMVLTIGCLFIGAITLVVATFTGAFQ